MTATATQPILSLFLTEKVATYLQRSPEQIDETKPLTDYGLDSVYALTLAGDLEDFLGITVDPSIVWDNPSISELSVALLALTQ